MGVHCGNTCVFCRTLCAGWMLQCPVLPVPCVVGAVHCAWDGGCSALCYLCRVLWVQYTVSGVEVAVPCVTCVVGAVHCEREEGAGCGAMCYLCRVLWVQYTVSGKKVEVAVRQTVHSEPVVNTSSLRNPASLQYFANRPEFQGW